MSHYCPDCGVEVMPLWDYYYAEWFCPTCAMAFPNYRHPYHDRPRQHEHDTGVERTNDPNHNDHQRE